MLRCSLALAARRAPMLSNLLIRRHYTNATGYILAVLGQFHLHSFLVVFKDQMYHSSDVLTF
jgi:hypothetical protein